MLYYSAMFQDLLPACRRFSHRLSRLFRSRSSHKTIIAPFLSEEGPGTPGYEVQHCSHCLKLVRLPRSPPVIVFHISSITSHTPPHTPYRKLG